MTDLKFEEEADALRSEMAKAVHFVLSGVPAHQAMQTADHLLNVMKQQLAGARVTFPSAPKYDGEAIASDWAAGLSLEQIMQKHQCSRRTAYNHHPQNKNKQAA